LRSIEDNSEGSRPLRIDVEEDVVEDIGHEDEEYAKLSGGAWVPPPAAGLVTRVVGDGRLSDIGSFFSWSGDFGVTQKHNTVTTSE